MPAAQQEYCDAIGHISEELLAGSDLIFDGVLLILPIPSVRLSPFPLVDVAKN